MARYKPKPKLDAYERKIEESLEDYAPVSPADKKRILQAAAKTQTISLRINENVLQSIKQKAADEGLPYQTLISSVLYKFSVGRLIDETTIRKAVAALK
jgi:predicted DNA binding CopG/RHH family protein